MQIYPYCHLSCLNMIYPQYINSHYRYFRFIIFLRGLFSTIKKLKKTFILFLILIIGIYVFKNHDDFPYYHLTYSLTLSENKYLFGLGRLGHGFRTHSSLFYFHSILYLSYIKYFLFHSGPFFIFYFSILFVLIK